VLLPNAPLLERALEDDVERRKIERLGEEVLRPFAHGLHGEIDRPVRGEDDDRHAGVDLAELGQELEGVPVGERVIDDRHVRTNGAKRLLGRLTAIRFRDGEAAPFQEIANAEARPRMVVDDQHSFRHESPLSTPIIRITRAEAEP
jgi:hypothetical protein